MPVPLDLLNAVGANALPVLAGGGVVAVEVGSTIIGKVWEWWGKKAKESERRQELEALAGATAQELRGAVKDLAAQLATGQPPPVQSKLEGYLMAVPAQIRRTLRRPSDAAGRTVPPDLVLNRAEDLAPLLPPRPPRFAAGEKVPGTDFELVELLGIGGFGEVWKARNTFMPGAAAVALKFCLDPDAAASLRRETALLDRIQREGKHPGIVELRHTFLSSEPPFLEYELVEGGDLGGLILDWHRRRGGPTPTEAARVVRRLAETVAFAHEKRIVHRDLKPANILLQGASGKGQGASGEDSGGSSALAPRPSPLAPVRLKIADFGIGGVAAEAAARQALFTRAGGSLTSAAAHGSYSLYYASPEQMRGAPPDPRDDVHALGVIWYQLLVGDLTAEAPRGAGWKKRLAAKGMPEGLVELLEACVASEREDRPADCRDVADRLGFVLAEPAPGIDLDFTPVPSVELAVAAVAAPAAQPVTAPPKPTAPAPLAAPVTVAAPVAPPAEDAAVPRGLTEELRKARWADLAVRLRHLRQTHERLRWAAGGLAWVVQLVLLLAASAGAGAGMYSILNSRSDADNQVLGQDIAARHSTPAMPIVWYPWASGGGHFALQPRPSSMISTMGPRFYVDSSSRYPEPAWGGATYSPVVHYGWVTPSGSDKEAVDRYIHDVNARLAEAVSEYDYARRGKDNLLFGFVAGISAFFLFGLVFLVVRRWVRRSLEAGAREEAEAIRTEFAAELRQLPEPLDLTRPAAVSRLNKALEDAGLAPYAFWVSPLRPWHRLLAPF